MAVQTRVRRIARNPRRTRVRMTPKQIRYFGTARQKAALKANRKRKLRHRATPHHRPRTVRRAVNRSAVHHHPRRTYRRNPPRVRTRTRTVTKIVYRRAKRKNRARARHRNPAPVVLTFGATNPRRRRSSMAKPRRRNSGSHHHRVRARSRNPKHVYRRRRNTATRRRYVVRRRHNPLTLFGGSGAKHTVEIVGGVLAGMAGTKFVPGMLPTSITSMGGSTIGPVVISGLTAYALKKLAEIIKKGAFADAVFLGGLAQTGSVLLNALVPSLWGQFGVSGFGAFVPGRFPVPQNPVTAGMQQAGTSANVGAANARIGVSGFGRAFGSAF